MKEENLSRSSLQQVGVEGTLLVLAPVPFMLASLNIANTFPPFWSLIVAAVGALSFFISGFVFFRNLQIGRFFATLALISSFAVSNNCLAVGPFATLLGSVAFITAGYALISFEVQLNPIKPSNPIERSLQRAIWSSITLFVIICFTLIIDQSNNIIYNIALAISVIIGQTLLVNWVWKRKEGFSSVVWTLLSIMVSIAIIISLKIVYIRIIALIANLLIIFLLPRTKSVQDISEHWKDTLLNHPARVLFLTFFALCLSGALLLNTPIATNAPGIAFIDAAFTSVSAVCVTGLVVLDTPNAFTLVGQFFIVLLIQLGGLGIMSITTVGLYAIGRRISLKQERLMTAITDTDHKDLFESLITILKFTFIVEGIGALILSITFFFTGEPVLQAIWEGIFTAISAFCNAGFGLQSDNLVHYQHNPIVLHTVALLIIFGGLAPTTSLILPKWFSRQPIPIAARIALTTTVILLISGTLFLLAIEWNGVLSGLSVIDKIHNAWFQSVTTRTAGFNSVDITGITGTSCLIMIALMFIGGSPGGTAGGVKTTTIGVLALAFWANINSRRDVIIQNRRIPSSTINRAITVVAAGGLIWIISVLMLEVTQQIPTRDIVFEVTSALGTVGLSTGATMYLDQIGKIIIMITMFAGRIGPMTLFTLLSEDHYVSDSRCLDAKITLT